MQCEVDVDAATGARHLANADGVLRGEARGCDNSPKLLGWQSQGAVYGGRCKTRPLPKPRVNPTPEAPPHPATNTNRIQYDSLLQVHRTQFEIVECYRPRPCMYA
jgi:hypothetical protein